MTTIGEHSMARQAEWHLCLSKCTIMLHFKCRAVTVGEKSFGKVSSLCRCPDLIQKGCKS